ncbi:MAG TPA: hypothetical protein EYG50_01530 [Cycloclasticus sp.]|jgi:alkane 1-monooxygenase/p-cymene monooxygenase|nr:hypothetical protein [Cycloclasticus sp.]
MGVVCLCGFTGIFCINLSAALTVLIISLVGQCIIGLFSYVQHYGLIPPSVEKRHELNHIRPLSRLLTFEIVTHSTTRTQWFRIMS